MSTPEGIVKAKVRRLLAQYDGMYSYWPVPSGLGRTTVDVIGCFRGRFFCVETKGEGKKPTLRQTQELSNVELAMGAAFVIVGPEDPALDRLREWFDNLRDTIPNAPHITPDTVDRRVI